jgi:hypothetical protein
LIQPSSRFLLAGARCAACNRQRRTLFAALLANTTAYTTVALVACRGAGSQILLPAIVRIRGLGFGIIGHHRGHRTSRMLIGPMPHLMVPMMPMLCGVLRAGQV